MAAITSVNAAQAIVKLVALEGVPALVGNLVMGNLVNRNYEAKLAQAGDTVNIPIPPVMKANNLAEGGSVQLQNPSLGNAQIVLNTHLESSFTIPDVTEVLVGYSNGDFGLLGKYMSPAIISVAEAIESLLLNLYPGFTANAAVGAAGTPLTESVIDDAETSLFKSKVPEGVQKYLILDGDGYSDVRQIERFSEDRMLAGGGQAIASGFLGQIKKFVVYRSQYVATTGSAPVSHHALGFAPDSIALVTRRLPTPLPGTGAVASYAEMGGFGMRIVMSYNPQTLAQQFTVDALVGCGVLRNQFAVPVLY